MKTTVKRKSAKRPKKIRKTQSRLFDIGVASNAVSVKRIDAQGNSTASLNLSATAFLLSGIAQGDSDLQRSGNMIRYKNIKFRAFVSCQPPVTGSYVDNYIRCIIAYDKMPNGALPIWTDIVLDQAGNAQPHSPLSFTNRDRFTVIMDKAITLDGFAVTVAASVPTYSDNKAPTQHAEQKHFEFFKDFKFDVCQKFYGTGATIASINQGALLMFLQGGFATNNPWFLEWSSAVTYSDTKN